MGNTATIFQELVSTSSYHSVSASSPEELETKVSQFIASLVGGSVGISDFMLTGTGDGLEFCVEFLLSSAVTPPTAEVEAVCWAGQGDVEFARNAAAAIARITSTLDIFHHAVAGSSKGLRRMGLMIGSPPAG